MSDAHALGPLLQAFARVCLDAAPTEADLARLAPDGAHAERQGVLVYREMILRRARNLVADVFPRTCAALGRPCLDAHAVQPGVGYVTAARAMQCLATRMAPHHVKHPPMGHHGEVCAVGVAAQVEQGRYHAVMKGLCALATTRQ